MLVVGRNSEKERLIDRKKPQNVDLPSIFGNQDHPRPDPRGRVPLARKSKRHLADPIEQILVMRVGLIKKLAKRLLDPGSDVLRSTQKHFRGLMPPFDFGKKARSELWEKAWLAVMVAKKSHQTGKATRPTAPEIGQNSRTTGCSGEIVGDDHFAPKKREYRLRALFAWFQPMLANVLKKCLSPAEGKGHG